MEGYRAGSTKFSAHGVGITYSAHESDGPFILLLLVAQVDPQLHANVRTKAPYPEQQGAKI